MREGYAADLAIFPSLYEPFGIVALEALANACPLVVSDAGGLAEVVQHGITGLVAPADNSGALADAGITRVGIVGHPEGHADIADDEAVHRRGAASEVGQGAQVVAGRAPCGGLERAGGALGAAAVGEGVAREPEWRTIFFAERCHKMDLG